MTVYELNRGQLTELKQDFLCHVVNDGFGTSYGALADADAIVSDWAIYDYYDGTMFTEDDFWG